MLGIVTVALGLLALRSAWLSHKAVKKLERIIEHD